MLQIRRQTVFIDPNVLQKLHLKACFSVWHFDMKDKTKPGMQMLKRKPFACCKTTFPLSKGWVNAVHLILGQKRWASTGGESNHVDLSLSQPNTITVCSLRMAGSVWPKFPHLASGDTNFLCKYALQQAGTFCFWKLTGWDWSNSIGTGNILSRNQFKVQVLAKHVNTFKVWVFLGFLCLWVLFHPPPHVLWGPKQKETLIAEKLQNITTVAKELNNYWDETASNEAHKKRKENIEDNTTFFWWCSITTWHEVTTSINWFLSSLSKVSLKGVGSRKKKVIEVASCYVYS